VIVPLKFRGRPIGIVRADNKPSRRPITAESVARLELFCQELAHSVNNARLYTEAQRREREVTVLFEFTRRVAATLDLDEVLDIITQYAIETLGCDGAAVYRWDATLGALVFAKSRHTAAAVPHAPQLQPGEGIAGRAFAERRPVWTNDRVSDPNVTYRTDTEEAVGRTARAFIGVPIVIRDEVYGVLLAHRLAPHEWSADEVRLLTRVSAPVAVAVENARLYAETQQNLAGAGLLNEAARTLHRTLDVRHRLPAALADLGRTVDAIGAFVSMFNGPHADQTIAWGAAAYAGAGCIVPLFRQRDEPLLVADVERLAETIPGATLSTEVRSLAAFPVRGRSRGLGVLTLLFGTRRVLSPFEQRLLAAYADQLAMALDNTALFEAAENQKTLLEHIFASTSDGILFLDRAGRIAALNRRGEELLGVSTLEVVGHPFVAYLVDALGERLRWVTPDGRTLQEIVEDLEQEASGDLEVREPSPATLRWHASPTLDTAGARVGVTVTLRDVTREREVDRMKTEFVSAVSHELRTPLTSIKGSLHLLLHEDVRPLETAQRELLAICLNNTDRLIRLITDILDVSKIEAGRIQLALSQRHVGEFIQIAVDGIRAFADSRDVRVVTELAASLPEVRVDLDRMVQVMTNLLSNAIKFSPPGSEVRVRADHAGAAVEIRVIDHGRGIAPGDLPRLFQKFQQLDSRTIREVGGTGLGLAICNGLVTEHGGAIRVESTPGQGSTFIVTLPAASIASSSTSRLL
jgi:PAS domain S-box-containing protein